ncbi:large subunit GTPase 1 homolog, partial [Ctenocephalides felis]|uniref:large subunit GTPase 1 homolog n=1 Tax=Ctenocephalides felis TaxID=7515 RepID=UPI000E6E4D8B
MGKKSKVGLGRSLIKDRFGHSKGRKTVDDNSMLHTTEIQDGYDWGRLNLQSVTEESSFQEFLSTAELAGTEFQAEKLNIKFVNPKVLNVGLLVGSDKTRALEEQEKNRQFLRIPRRPKWSSETSAEELQQNEREEFLKWRRDLATLQDNEGLVLTPYEKNLEFWRQLWRVVERSDVVVQIVDARNPLLFRCEDLELYVKEVSDDKMNLILVNKADFLTDEQRKAWARYFDGEGVRVAFFSAKLSKEKDGEKSDEELSEISEEDEDEDDDDLNEPEPTVSSLESQVEDLKKSVTSTEEKLNKILTDIPKITTEPSQTPESTTKEPESIEESKNSFLNSSELLTREMLIEFFKTIHTGPKYTSGITTIGLVGYPNVGKSSTINALMLSKKVSVSATPGKTKHFQTLYLDQDIMLCDCPGLVMPSFVLTKADMVINGILPIDQMRDHVPPINLVASLIPRHIIEDTYGIMIAKPLEGEDPDRAPVAEEVLNAYGYNRGFMTANGQPDCPRSARYILKDYVNGKLLYCYAPPNMKQDEYHIFPERKAKINLD